MPSLQGGCSDAESIIALGPNAPECRRRRPFGPSSTAVGRQRSPSMPAGRVQGGPMPKKAIIHGQKTYQKRTFGRRCRRTGDRKSVVDGQRVAGSVDLGGWRPIKKKK